jgi:CO/xanthine dehydrogenase FAD-binding subunit
LHSFEYHEPKTVQETCALLQEYGDQAKLLAGGTDLLVKFRNGVMAPQQIVNIKKIPGLREIHKTADGLQIGAAATMNEVEHFLAKEPAYEVLAQALHSVASYQIRNRATVVGNLCNASPAADTVPALVVLGAGVNVVGPNGNRSVQAEDFFMSPGRTVLGSGEWVTGLTIPMAAATGRGIYLKHSRRRMVDLATVGLAIFYDPPTIRLALGAVGPTVVRARAAETLLREKGLQPEVIEAAAELTMQAAAPISDIRSSREYRLHIVKILTGRALQTLRGGLGA